MATNTDWSKFHRRHLRTLLKIQSEAGVGKLPSLEDAIEAVRSEMEQEDINRVIEEMRLSGTLKD
ncbi:MAG: hypothetical protein FWB91_13175 [Defluviitaleaceae bacterium]|nr:hypothetical protein [Defluviitaleaceae bacterium]